MQTTELIQFYIYSNEPTELAARLKYLQDLLVSSGPLDTAVVDKHLVPRVSHLLAAKELEMFRCGLCLLDMTLRKSPIDSLPFLNAWTGDVLNCLGSIAIGRSSSCDPMSDCLTCFRGLDLIFHTCLIYGGLQLLRDVVNVHLPSAMSTFMKLLVVKSVGNDDATVALVKDPRSLLVQVSTILKRWTIDFTSLMKPYEERLSSMIAGHLFSDDMDSVAFRNLSQLQVSLCNCCQTKQKCIDKYLALQFAGLCAVQTHLDTVVSVNVDEEPFRRVEASFANGMKLVVPQLDNDYFHSYPSILSNIRKVLEYLEIVYGGQFVVAPAKVAMGETFDVIRRVMSLSTKYSRRKNGSDFEMFDMLLSLIPSLHCAFLKYTSFFILHVVGKRALRYRSALADMLNSVATESTEVDSIKLDLYSCIQALLPVMDQGFLRKIQKTLLPVLVKDMVNEASEQSTDERISEIEQVTSIVGRNAKKRKHQTTEVALKRPKGNTGICATGALNVLIQVAQCHGSVFAGNSWKSIDNIVVCTLIDRQSKSLTTCQEQMYLRRCLEYLEVRIQFCPESMNLSALMLNLAGIKQESVPVCTLASLIRPRRPFIASHDNARKHALEQEEIDLKTRPMESHEEIELKQSEMQTENLAEPDVIVVQISHTSVQTDEPVELARQAAVIVAPLEDRFEVSIEENPEIFNKSARVFNFDEEDIQKPSVVVEPAQRNIDSEDEFDELMIVDADPDE